MKIEFMNVNFVQSKLQHITSVGINEIKMKGNKLDALPPILAYIEDYAGKNGFTVLNANTDGSNIQIFLVKN